MTSRVLTFGEALAVLRTDEPVPHAATLRIGTGGAEANVAIGLARLGTPVTWAGRLGDDGLGRRVARELRAEGVDLSVVTDPARPTGWNNLVFPNVGMPHALYQLQGVQRLKTESSTDAHGHKTEAHSLVLETPGSMTALQYDQTVGDLVNYLVYMGEPTSQSRLRLGIYVMLYLVLFIIVAWLLKRAYWKDVH